MRALTSRNQRMQLVRRVITADGRAWLHERAGGALVADRLFDDDMRVLDGGLHGGAIAEGAVEREIVGGIRPDRRRPGRGRLPNVRHRPPGLTFTAHPL